VFVENSFESRSADCNGHRNRSIHREILVVVY
jgi:hypothetical protein